MEKAISMFINTLEAASGVAKLKGEDRVKFDIPLDAVDIIKKKLEYVLDLEKECVADNSEKHPVVNGELAATIEGMTSPDYKERFKAEYRQTKIRYERLKALNTKIEAAQATSYRKGGVEFPLFECPTDILRDQQRLMGELLHILEVRAVIEGVDL
jgi:hypothetical protein